MRKAVVAVVAAAAMAVTLAPVGASATTPDPLGWGACPEGAVTGPVAPQVQCTTVPVPLDYTTPEGKTIEIMISRLASQNPAKRRGVLLLNPGGPGGAGLSQPADLVSLGLPASVSDSYDLIGMDPRGVGHSAPVSCGFTVEQGHTGNIPPYAPDAAAVAEQAKVAKAVADQCAANDQDGTLRHMSTANTARDMDRIRTALGEQKISYFGVSYGSALGAAYASLFPERTERVVLDSNVGGTAFDIEGVRRFGLGAEQRFPDFAKFAAARHASYGLGRTPGEVRRNYFELAERLDREPVGPVNGAMFRLVVFAGMYADFQFPQTAQLWQSLAVSDQGAVRRHLDDARMSRWPGLPGLGASPTSSASGAADAATPSPFDNTWSAFLAVTCNDSTWPGDVATYQQNVVIDRVRYPLFGAASANISPCAYWPYEPAEPPVQIIDDGPSNVLIVQNLRDPATPHLGGVLLRMAFGDRAQLVSIDQGGHGAYVYDDNPCGLNVTTTYLVEGERPGDTYCPASNESGLKLDAAAERLRAETLDRLGG
jgi:pimeloyl-ACP methyl ester carboxylesterase